MASEEIQQFLKTHKPNFRLLDSGKIHCELNGHAFPPNLQALNAFVNGNKYKRLCKTKEAAAKLNKYDPFIVPSKNFPTMLYCALTGQLLETSLDAVQRHMKGKRFTTAREKFQNSDGDLRPEPEIGQIMKTLGADEDMEESEEAGPASTEGEFWVPAEEVGPSAQVVNGNADEMEVSEDEVEEKSIKPHKKKSKTGKKSSDDIGEAATDSAAAGVARQKKKRKIKPSAPKKQKL